MKSRYLTSSVFALLITTTLLAGCGGGDGHDGSEVKGSVHHRSFASPKGNIGCIADGSMVRCDIRGQRRKVKPNPSCPVDWGNGLSVGGGHGRIVCAGDTVMTDGPLLESGLVNRVGSFECETGGQGNSMRCENIKTGHGFELSPTKFRTF